MTHSRHKVEYVEFDERNYLPVEIKKLEKKRFFLKFLNLLLMIHCWWSMYYVIYDPSMTNKIFFAIIILFNLIPITFNKMKDKVVTMRIKLKVSEYNQYKSSKITRFK